MSDVELLREAAKVMRERADAAPPGPWCFNSYSSIWSAPRSQVYDEWLVSVLVTEPQHTLERYGSCPVCGDWKRQPYVPSPGLGHGCRLFDDDYRRDPCVAWVPAHHGDTAIGANAAAGEHIASWHPAVALAVADWLEAVADYDMGDTNELESAETVARVYLGRRP